MGLKNYKFHKIFIKQFLCNHNVLNVLPVKTNKRHLISKKCIKEKIITFYSFIP